MPVALNVNIDHVATLRQARGTAYPDPVEAAFLCERAGADGITVHLREDRRHIQDRDVRVLRQTVQGVFNLEMAATAEMLALAVEIRPQHVTLVPERREERTTEGGLDVVTGYEPVKTAVLALQDVGIKVSVFISHEPKQIDAAARMGADQVEFHTGDFANAPREDRGGIAAGLAMGAAQARRAGMRVAAGHGLTAENVTLVAKIPELEELNIGHAIVADAMMVGMAGAVRAMRQAIRAARARR